VVVRAADVQSPGERLTRRVDPWFHQNRLPAMRRRPIILRCVALLQMVFVLSLFSVRICGMREHAREAEQEAGTALHDCCRTAGIGALPPDCCVRACDGEAAVRPARASWVFVVAPSAGIPTPKAMILPPSPPTRVRTAARSSPPIPLRV
jgi:hypothetical protein